MACAGYRLITKRNGGSHASVEIDPSCKPQDGKHSRRKMERTQYSRNRKPREIPMGEKGMRTAVNSFIAGGER